MQQQSNMQNKFLIDADIGDDDVTLPSLPAVDVPIIEPAVKTTVETTPAPATNVEITEQHQSVSSEEEEETKSTGFFGRMKDGLTKTRRSFTDGMVNILIGGKEIDDELLEEVEEQLLVADIGVEATKTIIANLTERTARGDLIYSHALYKALQEELVAIFDNPSTWSIVPSNFPGLTAGCLWYCISLFRGSGLPEGVSFGHVGDIYINYPQHKATGSNGMSTLFSPCMVRPTEGFAVYGEYSNDTSADGGFTQAFASGRSGTIFSSKQDPGPNGYHSSTQFSADDGIWGFREEQILDGAGALGSTLNTTSTQKLITASGSYGAECFGIQNFKSTDSSANDLFWSSNNPIYNDSNLRCYVWSAFN